MPPDTAGGSAAQTRQRLLGLLGPVISAAGYDLEDVTVTAAGRRSLVRVSVDADGGIDLDAVADVSRVVSEAIDASDADSPGTASFTGPYVLEVSSPGVERPLIEPRHWQRAVGRQVQVQVREHMIIGRVIDTSDSGVALDVAGARRDVPWAELGRGTVQVEFNRPGDTEGEGAEQWSR
jgi:ribosome maturation factor RimP